MKYTLSIEIREEKPAEGERTMPSHDVIRSFDLEADVLPLLDMLFEAVLKEYIKDD